MSSHSELLSNIYFDSDNSAGFSSKSNLFKAAIKKNPKVSREDVSKFFQSHPIPSIYAKAVRKFPRSIFKTRSPNWEYQADLGDFSNLKKQNSGYSWLLIVIDTFSRRIIALKAQKKKTGVETAKSLDEVFEKNKCKVLFTDSGKEFINKDCDKIYTKFGVKHVNSNDNVMKAATCERILRNVKSRLFKIMAKNKTQKWVQFLAAVQKALNDSYNRDLKFTPNQVHFNAKNRYQAWHNSVEIPEAKRLAKFKKFKFNVNDVVRVVRYKSSFHKSYLSNWDRLLYIVTGRKMDGGIDVYTLKDFLTFTPVRGRFYSQELSKVNIAAPKKAAFEKIYGIRENGMDTEIKVEEPDSKKKTWLNVNLFYKYQNH